MNAQHTQRYITVERLREKKLDPWGTRVDVERIQRGRIGRSENRKNMALDLREVDGIIRVESLASKMMWTEARESARRALEI